MLTGIFVYTLPPPKKIDPSYSEPLFDACIKEDIQHLYGCSSVPDIFGKIETFCFQNEGQKYQLLVIIPPQETLIALLRELYPEIKFIFWSQELVSDDVFRHWRPLAAGTYQNANDLIDFIQIIKKLIGT